MTTTDAALNAIEAAFKSSRLDLSHQAILCTAMIEGILGITASSSTRAKMEEKLVHGITAEHITQALELLRLDIA
ncbi:hypothetical protein FJ872_17870 [Mesorhizobium sp. B2-5-9]|uniref:hypothetical protein n=1 Tax=Mesorhizobium sp. B2-5-9 TaxID=2589921 RepID=UPI001127D3C1|nr:hypothetical protein [Mesorhizobium sp. B2-5-9]TPK16670.1 hypothetical protein FJ872_17870 [Mesorhizobium sp. B2-5-9]